MDWHSMDCKAVVGALGADSETGLSQKEALSRQSRYGPNELQTKKPKSLFKRLIAQLSDFMVLVLLAAAVVSFLTSVIKAEPDFLDPLVILGIVLLNAALGLMQESRAQRAIEALKRLCAPAVKVMRDGRRQILQSRELVPGDLIFLEAGDLVPADARLLTAENLRVDEAALTGESVPVQKETNALVASLAALGDRKNMVYSGSMVASGRCTALVTETGMRTQVGRIAGMISEQQAPQTPLQRRLEHTGKVLGTAALFLCAGIFGLGMARRGDPLEMFMLAVSLAVAAIPEGLPAIVTIVLAVGVQRMAKNNAIIRRLTAVETLGGATVICSDKTGTLTQNSMTVTALASPKGELELYGAPASRLLELFSMCSNVQLSDTGQGGPVRGDPTEAALVTAAFRCGVNKAALDKRYPRVGELPFESARKLMTTVHRLPRSFMAVTKGAADVLLGRCTHYEEDGRVHPLTEEKRQNILLQNEALADRALRVLGAAYKNLDRLPAQSQLPSVEDGLVFCGLAGMIDPPRPEAKQAVAMCRRAGVRPVMITGDHKSTAAAIAGELGILRKGGEILTGAELDRLSDRELFRAVESCAVYARVSPEHKARIVRALQRRGHVVAMTGDGVNDAPALKAADIGCAMGMTGTDVAREAADMVLADDNFATIVSAVREGRGIYQNIRKAVHFLLSSNVGELLTIFVAFLLGWPAPLLPIQLLWVNLVTDSLPALALGMEKIESDVMDKRPLSPKKSLFSGGLAGDILTEGIMIGALALIAFFCGSSFFDADMSNPAVGRTMAFCVLSLSQLFHSFNTRSGRSLFAIGPFGNKAMLGAFAAGALMQAAVVSVAPLAALFHVTPLNGRQWLITAALSATPILLVELGKAAGRSRRKG